jgi:hypothetical protein
MLTDPGRAYQCPENSDSVIPSRHNPDSPDLFMFQTLIKKLQRGRSWTQRKLLKQDDRAGSRITVSLSLYAIHHSWDCINELRLLKKVQVRTPPHLQPRHHYPVFSPQLGSELSAVESTRQDLEMDLSGTCLQWNSAQQTQVSHPKLTKAIDSGPGSRRVQIDNCYILRNDIEFTPW